MATETATLPRGPVVGSDVRLIGTQSDSGRTRVAAPLTTSSRLGADAQVCGFREERASIKAPVGAAANSHTGPPNSGRPSVRLPGLVPAALLLSGLR